MSEGGSAQSPFVLITRLGNQITAALSVIDIDDLSRQDRNQVELIRRLLLDGRLDIRDYELSETRDEQLENAATAIRRIEELRSNILIASEHDLFSAIDVGMHSARLDEIVANLR